MTCAGKPHIIKEENYLLFGVVEEKAMKTASKKITFDFWSVRQNVLQDRRFNAALVLQQVWRARRERRRRKSSARSRSTAHPLRGLPRTTKLASTLQAGPPSPSTTPARSTADPVAPADVGGDAAVAQVPERAGASASSAAGAVAGGGADLLLQSDISRGGSSQGGSSSGDVGMGLMLAPFGDGATAGVEAV